MTQYQLPSFDISRKSTRLLFFFGLLLLSVFLLYEVWGYRREARLFPLIILTISGFLIVIQLLIHVNDVVDQYLLPATIGADMELFEPVGEVLEQDETPPDVRQEIRMIGWVVIFTMTFFYVGFITTIPILLFAFLIVESNLTLLRVAILAALVSLAVYLIFIEGLGIRIT